MNKYVEDEYYKLYSELAELVRKPDGILQWYDYDKVKEDSVYIWTKATDPNDMSTWGANLFDICSDQLVFYVKNHEVIEAAWPAIKEIQAHLLKMEEVARK